MAAEYRRRRDFIHPAIAAIPGVTCPEPEGGFYVFPDVSRCLSKEVPDTLALGARLLEEKAVAVVPGEGFHAPGYLPALVRDRLRGPAGGRAAASPSSSRSTPAGRAAVKRHGLRARGRPVLVYLHTPREKVFGVLLSLQPAGIAVRGHRPRRVRRLAAPGGARRDRASAS